MPHEMQITLQSYPHPCMDCTSQTTTSMWHLRHMET